MTTTYADLGDLLAHIDPGAPPSKRYNRIVTVGAARVLEMRDPNSGQDPDPASKPRHQYLMDERGQMWARRLPPETVGDAWQDIGVPRWEPSQPSGLLAEAARLMERRVRVAKVRRLRQHSSSSAEYVIRGEVVDIDEAADVAVVAGPITSAWWEVPLPPCPDCGGDLVWYEAGYVPGTRRCMGRPVSTRDGLPSYDIDAGCGSLFTVDTA